MRTTASNVYKAAFIIAGLLVGCLLLAYVLITAVESSSRTAYREVEGLRVADYPDAASTLRLTFELDSTVKENSTTTISYPISNGFDWIKVRSAGVAYEVVNNGDGGSRLILSCVGIDLAQPVVVDIHYPLDGILVSETPVGCAVEGGIGLADANLEDPRLAEIIATAGIRNEADIVDWMRENIALVEATDIRPSDCDATSVDGYDPCHLQDVTETLDRGKGDCKARVVLFCGFLRELDPSVEFEMILCYPQGYEARLGDPDSPWTHVLVRVKKSDHYLIFDPILDAQYASNGKRFLGIPITGALRGNGETILTAASMVPAGPYLVEIQVLDPEIDLEAVRVAVFRS